MTRPCACGVIDVHTHYVPHDFPGYAGRHAGARWPSMQPDGDCHRNVIFEGKVYRKVSHHCWTPVARLEDMDAQGVDRQVVSPMPELLSRWLAPEDGAALCRYLNESLAELAATKPGRLRAIGAVPLQDVDLAIAELVITKTKHQGDAMHFDEYPGQPWKIADADLIGPMGLYTMIAQTISFYRVPVPDGAG